ncbi:unnamed protein product [Blepharisma stoltei]|uniref:Autophagy-related protein n=1 Tax=Blepharisma stoltei TaxID=1481888 RepID=A0AAU9J9Q6_9CILI|nr:unnamed protein product [Blepharisma stoltei]
MSTIEAATFEQRLQQAARFKAKYQNAVPVVIQSDARSSLPKTIHNSLFVVQKSLSAGELLGLIRKKTSLPKSQAIAMFVGHRIMVTNDITLCELYERYSNEDGFLYILCKDEEVYGN